MLLWFSRIVRLIVGQKRLRHWQLLPSPAVYASCLGPPCLTPHGAVQTSHALAQLLQWIAKNLMGFTCFSPPKASAEVFSLLPWLLLLLFLLSVYCFVLVFCLLLWCCNRAKWPFIDLNFDFLPITLRIIIIICRKIWIKCCIFLICFHSCWHFRQALGTKFNQKQIPKTRYYYVCIST